MDIVSHVSETCVSMIVTEGAQVNYLFLFPPNNLDVLVNIIENPPKNFLLFFVSSFGSQAVLHSPLLPVSFGVSTLSL